MVERKHAKPRSGQTRKETRDEDYGNRGLHRQAGSTKDESLRSHGLDAESRETHWAAKKPAARKGRKVARGQSTGERKAITRDADRQR